MKVMLSKPDGCWNLTVAQAHCYLRSFKMDVELKGTVKLMDGVYLICQTK